MTDLTSVSLLHRMQDGTDCDAWSRFHAKYHDFIFDFLTRRNVDVHVAEDVCQNVMKQVYEAVTDDRFQHNGHTGAFRTWLRRIVSTQLALHRRKQASTVRLPSQLDPELSKDDSRLAQMWDEEHNRAVLNTLLDRLRNHAPEDSVAIFRRTFVDGISAEEAAEEFGRTKNAIIVARCKVLKKARELAGQFPD